MSQVKKISAKSFVEDVKSGLRGSELIEKYNLSSRRLSMILDKCLEQRLLTSDDVCALPDRSPSARKPPEGEAFRPEPDAEPAPDHPAPTEGLASMTTPNSQLATNGSSPCNAGSPGALSDGSRSERGQGSTVWALKLYSKTIGAREKFVGDLAAILAIAPGAASDLLDRAPVTIKSGLTKDKAELLSGVLGSIGALCLIEEQTSEEDGSEAAAPAPEIPFFLSRGKTSEENGFLPERMRASTVVMAGAVFILCLLAVYLIHRTSTLREEQVTTGKGTLKLREARGKIKSETYSEQDTRLYLLSEIDRLEGEVNLLESRIFEARTELDSLSKSRAEFQEKVEKEAEIRGMNYELVRKTKELKSFRKRLDSFMKGSGEATEEEGQDQGVGL
jgi:hypothetical protein